MLDTLYNIFFISCSVVLLKILLEIFSLETHTITDLKLALLNLLRIYDFRKKIP